MKKLIYIAIAISIIATSCSKKDDVELNKTTITNDGGYKASPKVLSMLLKALSLKVVVSYYEGRLEWLRYEYYDNGNIKSVEIHCYNVEGICHIKGIASAEKSSPEIFVNTENGWELNVPVSQATDNYNGCVGEYENELLFFFDLSKVPENVKSRFTAENIEIMHNYALDLDLAKTLGIDPNKLVVPKGSYTLYKDGNIAWYIIDKSKLTNAIE